MTANAETSGNVSSRDGVLMKRLPEGSRFGHRGLVQYLQVRARAAVSRHACSALTAFSPRKDALLGNEALVRSSMSAHFGVALAAAQGTRGRHMLYALRSMALLQAGKPALSLKVRLDGQSVCVQPPCNRALRNQDACAAVAFANGSDAELVLAAHAAAAEALASAEPVRVLYVRAVRNFALVLTCTDRSAAPWCKSDAAQRAWQWSRARQLRCHSFSSHSLLPTMPSTRRAWRAASRACQTYTDGCVTRQLTRELN